MNMLVPEMRVVAVRVASYITQAKDCGAQSSPCVSGLGDAESSNRSSQLP